MRKISNEKQKMLNEAGIWFSSQSLPINDEVIKKATAKAERWMRAAWGGVDWVSYFDEVGEIGISTYLADTLEHLDGRNTTNRKLFGRVA